MKYKFVHLFYPKQAFITAWHLRTNPVIIYAADLMKFFLVICAFGVLFVAL